LPAQRVTVLLNGHVAATAQARDTCVLSIPVPAAVARSGRAVEVTLRFPDSARPSEVHGSDDNRILGFSLHRIALFQSEPVSDAVAASKPGRRSPGQVAPKSEADQPRSVACEKTDALVVARLADVFREAFRLPRLDYHARTVLRKIAGYDAASFVHLILALEAQFSIALQEDDVDQIETMGDVVALLQGKLRVAAQSAAPEMAK
jgi:acyl carrier protein